MTYLVHLVRPGLVAPYTLLATKDDPQHSLEAQGERPSPLPGGQITFGLLVWWILFSVCESNGSGVDPLLQVNDEKYQIGPPNLSCDT